MIIRSVLLRSRKHGGCIAGARIISSILGSRSCVDALPQRELSIGCWAVGITTDPLWLRELSAAYWAVAVVGQALSLREFATERLEVWWMHCCWEHAEQSEKKWMHYWENCLLSIYIVMISENGVRIVIMMLGCLYQVFMLVSMNFYFDHIGAHEVALFDCAIFPSHISDDLDVNHL